MHKTLRLLLLIVLACGAFLVPAAPLSAQGGSRHFDETGKTVEGLFLSYWENHGGLPQQGYPISEKRQQQSATDGKVYTVQYFERAVFEHHPEYAGTPNEVLLSLLGTFLYKERYPAGAPDQAANSSAGAVQFKETGKTLGGRFLEYWQKNGGLAQQGYPISDEFQEKSELDGKTYTVQYFERAVFEHHPENSPPYDVLLSQLGKFRYDKREAEIARSLETFDRSWELVRENYVYKDYRGLDWQALRDEFRPKVEISPGKDEAYRYISDMILRLDDRHSHFLDPQRRAEDDALKSGELKLSGIGVTTQEIEGARRITYVVPGGPADRAGLRVFDIMLGVNGARIDQDADAVRNIRGPEGTSVTLTVQSPGQAPRDVTIVRETITFTYHASARRLPGTNIAYLNIPTFIVRGIAREVRQELEKLAAAGPLDGAIVDIRLNGGGFIVEEMDTAKLFVDGGVGGYSATRAGREPNRIPSGQTLPALRGKPVVVLVSNACESACEHFTVAMQDLKRGTVVGTNTAGNTETIYPYDMADGSRLMLAEAMFLRPDGSSIEDKGVTPDVVLDVPWYAFPLGEDPQVQKAVELIGSR